MLKAAVNTMAKISLVARRLLIFKIALVIHFSSCSLVMRAIVRSILDSEAILAGDRDCFGGGDRCNTNCFLSSWGIRCSGCVCTGRCGLGGVEGLWEERVSIGMRDARTLL